MKKQNNQFGLQNSINTYNEHEEKTMYPPKLIFGEDHFDPANSRILSKSIPKLKR